MQSSFIVYLIGYILVIAGVAYGMMQAGVNQTWVVVAVLILAGLGIVYAFSRSQRDEAAKNARNTGSAGGGAAPQSGQAQGNQAQGGAGGGQQQTGGGQAQTGGQSQGGQQQA